jgi:DNA repair exonuclease SbcCD ATPase subunit
MSESEGLAKLTEYLKNTRRQAEQAIDILNSKLSEVTTENETLRKQLAKCEFERESYRRLTEELKAENTTKTKFQERDDWKSLVSSIQKDRSRLQEECSQLESNLNDANMKIMSLEQELLSLNKEIEYLQQMRNDGNNKVEEQGDVPRNGDSFGLVCKMNSLETVCMDDIVSSPKRKTVCEDLEHINNKQNHAKLTDDSEVRGTYLQELQEENKLHSDGVSALQTL